MLKFRKIVFIGFVIGIVIFILNTAFSFFYQGSLSFDEVTLMDFGYNLYYSISITAVNVYFFDYMNKVKWGEYLKYKLIIGFVGGVLLTLCTVFLLRAFYKIYFNDFTFNAFVEKEMSSGAFYLTVLLITLAISIFFHAFYFYRELQKNKVKEQKIIAGTASAQFDALRNQLDPHFLFNSLNVLTSLIDENPENAQRFTTALSKVYRYVLEQKNKELISVDEELKFAKSYIGLLKMRFEDSITFDIPDKASNSEAKVVPLSLQLLLENAVKHNVIDSNNPLRIKIYEEGGNLIVENNLQIKKILKKSSGVGLTNIKQRYQLLTNRKVQITKTETYFSVALPMLTKQDATLEIRNASAFDEKYIQARKHVDDLKEFYYSFISYIIIIPFLIFIWYRFTPHAIQWFWFPMFGWGIGLFFQGYKVFVNDAILGSNWEKKKMEEFMGKEKQKKWN